MPASHGPFDGLIDTLKSCVMYVTNVCDSAIHDAPRRSASRSAGSQHVLVHRVLQNSERLGITNMKNRTEYMKLLEGPCNDRHERTKNGPMPPRAQEHGTAASWRCGAKHNALPLKAINGWYKYRLECAQKQGSTCLRPVVPLRQCCSLDLRPWPALSLAWRRFWSPCAWQFCCGSSAVLERARPCPSLHQPLHNLVWSPTEAQRGLRIELSKRT